MLPHEYTVLLTLPSECRGRVLDSRLRGRWFESHWRHCVVSLRKNINPSLVLVQPRKTCPFITERLLMGRKESNQTNKTYSNWPSLHMTLVYLYVTPCVYCLNYSYCFYKGGEIEKDATGDVETDNDKEMIPNESDFLVGYATVPGYVSFRSRNHGSWYIRKLCEALEKYSER